MKQLRHGIAVVFVLVCLIPSFSETPPAARKYTFIELGYDYFELSESRILYRNITGLEVRGVSGHYAYPEEIRLEDFSRTEEHGIARILDSSGKPVFLFLENSGFLFVYHRDANWDYKRNYFIGSAPEPRVISVFAPNPDSLSSSSYLTEGETHYDASALGYARLDSPWVEGVPGTGVGEYIEFTLESTGGEEKADGIIFLNGYISWDKPYLYERNARVKTVLFQDLTVGYEHLIELKDTAAPQIYKCEGRGGHRIRLVIADVYPGTRYEDTCLGGVLLYR